MNDVISVIALVWRCYTRFYLVADFFYTFEHSMRCQVECLCERMFSIYCISVSILSFCTDTYQHLHTFLYRSNLNQALIFWIFRVLTGQLYSCTRNFVLKQKCMTLNGIYWQRSKPSSTFNHFFWIPWKKHENLFFFLNLLPWFLFSLSFLHFLWINFQVFTNSNSVNETKSRKCMCVQQIKQFFFHKQLFLLGIDD